MKETVDKIYWKYNSGIKNLLLEELKSQFYDGLLTEEYFYLLKNDLIKFKLPGATTLLIKILQSLQEYPISLEEISIKVCVVDILGYISDSQAISALITALQDDFWQTRYSAVLSLARLNAQEAIEPISQLVYDENEDVRDAAIMTIKQLSDGV